MKIILENVQKGARVTGVAKIVDGQTVINNVPFNVGSKKELDAFVDNLLVVQADFATVQDGEYSVSTTEEVVNPIDKALDDVYTAKSQLGARIINDAEYEAIVLRYKTLLSEEVKPK